MPAFQNDAIMIDASRKYLLAILLIAIGAPVLFVFGSFHLVKGEGIL